VNPKANPLLRLSGALREVSKKILSCAENDETNKYTDRELQEKIEFDTQATNALRFVIVRSQKANQYTQYQMK
jgi:hypothetical protein